MATKRADETAAWEYYRPLLKELFITQNRTIREIGDIMARDFHFDRKQHQYEKRLKDWKFRKNFKRKEWKMIEHVIRKGELQGKSVRIAIDGVSTNITRQKKDRAIARHHQSYLERLTQGPRSPSPVAGCRVRSQPRHEIYDFSAYNLPWLRFTAPTPDHNFLPVPSGWMRAVSGSGLIEIAMDHEKAIPSITELFRRLQISIHVSMPKWPTATATSKSENDAYIIQERSSFLELLKLATYILSNNLGRNVDIGGSVIELCQQGKNLAFLQRLLEDKQPTTEAMAEKLLSHAILLGNKRIVEVLLSSGVDPNGRRHGKTYLLHAIENRDLEISKLLLKYGADVNNSIPSVLDRACLLGQVDFVKDLVDRGARSFDGSLDVVPLAAQSGNVELVDFMLTYQGYDGSICFTGLKQSLYYGVKSHSLKMVKYLLSKGVDIEHRGGTYKQTPLEKAVTDGDIAIASVLLNHGANPNKVAGMTISSLCHACESEDMDLAQLLLEHGADPNLRGTGRKPNTALYIAATKGNLKLVQLLLGFKARTELRQTEEDNLLLYAIEGGNVDVIMLFLEAGAYDFTGDESQSGLQAAIEMGREDIVRLLLNYKSLVDINTPPIPNEWGASALSAALRSGNLALVELCLEHGANVNLPSNDDPAPSPLEACIENFDLAMLERLISLGAKPADLGALSAAVLKDDTGMVQLLKNYIDQVKPANCSINLPCAIRTAIEADNIALLHILVELEFDLTDPGLVFEPDRGYDHLTGIWVHGTYRYANALSYAVMLERTKIIQQLINLGVNVNEAYGERPGGTHSESYRSLGSAISYANPSNFEIMSMLLKAGAQSNSEFHIYQGFEDVRQLSVLANAVGKEEVDTVQLLLDHGADANSPSYGTSVKTPLQAAAEIGHIELVRLLLSHSANVNAAPASYRGATALQYAAMKGHIQVAYILLKAGADINAKGAEHHGQTALEGAAENGRLDMVQYLLEAGACILGEASEQFSRAVLWARMEGHFVIAKLLVEFKKKLCPEWDETEMATLSESEIVEYDTCIHTQCLACRSRNRRNAHDSSTNSEPTESLNSGFSVGTNDGVSRNYPESWHTSELNVRESSWIGNTSDFGNPLRSEVFMGYVEEEEW